MLESMDPNITPILFSRLQFAVTTIFHILWPVLTIGLGFYMVLMEALWLKTGKEIYFRHVRFWSKIFILGFGIGVASGLPLEFQFGTNWAGFSKFSGDFFGNILGYEAAMAFALEAAFLAIFIFGWHRVSRRVHFFSTLMVAFGATLSAFWIMAANSWMQDPQGVKIIDGKIVVTNYAKALFNPDLGISFSHMWIACISSSVFFVAGISAWNILKKKHVDFFMKSFKMAVVIAVFAAPLQVFLGDASGQLMKEIQPAKLAGIEAHWDTNKPGTGAAWSFVAWPDRSKERNAWALKIPNGLSLLTTRSLRGQVKGLRDFPPDSRPPIVIPFYAFRLMVLLGFTMVFLVFWALWNWYRGRLASAAEPPHKRFWTLWIWAVPAGFIATELGWIVREVGRQPWVVYNLMRTEDGATDLASAVVGSSLILYIIIYLALLLLFIAFSRRIMMRGPDMKEAIPADSKYPASKPSETGSKGKR
jgi:cytochrome d ubiquinol oxidase subunit I